MSSETAGTETRIARIEAYLERYRDELENDRSYQRTLGDKIDNKIEKTTEVLFDLRRLVESQMQAQTQIQASLTERVTKTEKRVDAQDVRFNAIDKKTANHAIIIKILVIVVSLILIGAPVVI